MLGFFAESFDGRIDELNLTPRLVGEAADSVLLLPRARATRASARRTSRTSAPSTAATCYLRDDPDFREPNPDNWQRFSSNPAIVLPGPAGADAMKQVWTWILADDEARAWLAGDADPWGMTVNPYYLPKGHPDAKVPVFDDNGDQVMEGGQPKLKAVGLSNPDGTPMKISETVLDRFMKVDETQVPLKLPLPTQTRFDSFQAFPYVETLRSGGASGIPGRPRREDVLGSERAQRRPAARETG